MGIYATRRGHEVSGAGVGGYVCPMLTEYRCPVHRHSADTGAMFVGGKMVVGAGFNDMVGTGWTVNRSGRVGDGYGDGLGRGSGIL